ncbi:SxtJ family membrane protein [Pelagibacteraceae bacterium]|jgi:hypothetical protein|nr:SxtJ family membrane protein [Pelagibacteraceae bacterium]|tara:strand:- start:695 stop:1075 length:381 start_codon:yes stop_codon:yes gene_type:complete
MRTKNNSNKSFGILFSIVFFLISFWPLLAGENIRIWSLVISIIFLILGLLNSKFLGPLNNSWIKIGEILGRVVAPIMMAIIYFIVLTPLSLLIKLFGKDLLQVKFSNVNSYWIKRKKNVSSMRKQF